MMSWRDHVSIHPAADLFPLLGDAELRELADDIKANGLHEMVKFIEVGDCTDRSDYKQILIDGRNRLDAMELAGIQIITRFDGVAQLYGNICEPVPDETDPVAYVIGVNIKRRHLTGEQKRDLIAKLLKTSPERSNLQTAKIVGVDDKTVASVRRDMEARSEIPNVATRVDTKGRQQPASKPPKTTPEMQVAKVAEIAESKAQAKDAKPAPVDDDEDYPEPIAFIGADVPGAAATNRMIERIVELFEGPSFEAWIKNHAGFETASGLVDALTDCAGEVERRVLEPIRKQEQAQHRADRKIFRAYDKRFGFYTDCPDRDHYRRMEASLKSGVDELAEEKERHERGLEREGANGTGAAGRRVTATNGAIASTVVLQ
jgi:hypothetical protein